MQPEYTSGYFLSSQYDCYPASFSFPLLFLLLIRGLSAQLYYFQGDVYFTPDTFKIFYLCLDFCNFVKIFQGFVFCFWGFFFDASYFRFTGPCDSVSEGLQSVLENSQIFSSEVLHKSLSLSSSTRISFKNIPELLTLFGMFHNLILNLFPSLFYDVYKVFSSVFHFIKCEAHLYSVDRFPWASYFNFNNYTTQI